MATISRRRRVLGVAAAVGLAMPLLLLLAQPASAVPATDGQGTMGRNPGFVSAGTTTTINFNFAAGAGDFPANSTVTLAVPALWTAPTLANTTLTSVSAGCAGASITGITGTGPWTITVNQGCTATSGFTIHYASVTAPATPGNYTFTAQSAINGGTLTNLASSPVVNVFAAANKLGITVQPSPSTNGGVVWATQPSVAVQDSGGNTVTNDNTTQVTLAIGNNAGSPSPGTLTCTATTVVVSGGVGHFAGCSIDKPGTGYTLNVTSNPVLTPTTSNAFNITTGPVNKLVFTTAPQALTTNVTSGNMTVQRQDVGGNPTSPAQLITVNLATNSGGGIFRDPTDTNTILSVTIASGASTSGVFRYRDSVVGSPTLTASSVSVPNAGTQIESVAGTPSKLVFTQQPSSSTSNAAFATQPQVTVEDAGNNIITGDNTTQVTLTIGTNPSVGTLACTTNPVTVASGVATFAGCKIDKAGTGYTLVASSSPVLAQATSNPFNITAGPLDHLVLSPASTTISAGVNQPYLAQGFDAANNSLGDVTAATTFTIGPNGSCAGTPGPSPTCTSMAAGAHTVTGTDAGKIGTASLGVNAGALDHLVLSPASSSIPSGASQPYTAQGQDVFNNSLGDVTGATTFSITPNGSCTGASCTATAAGAHTVTGTDATKTGTASLTVTAASKLAFTQQPSASTNGGVVWPTQPKVAVEDTANNVIVGDNTTQVTLAIGTNPGAGTLGCTTNPVTVVNGVANFAGCKIDKAGAGYTLVASSSPVLTQATSNTFNITVGPMDHLALSPASSSLTTGGSQAYTAQGRDAGDNSLGDVTAATTFTIGPNGSCTGTPGPSPTCTASAAGAHTVTGTDAGKTGTASLTFNAPVSTCSTNASGGPTLGRNLPSGAVGLIVLPPLFPSMRRRKQRQGTRTSEGTWRARLSGHRRSLLLLLAVAGVAITAVACTPPPAPGC